MEVILEMYKANSRSHSLHQGSDSVELRTSEVCEICL